MSKPIIFSTEMVKAILDGRKTMTRRVIKPQPEFYGDDCFYTWKNFDPTDDIEKLLLESTPFGALGDFLWVRETWAANIILDAFLPREIPENLILDYFADGDKGKLKLRGKWRSSRFMCRWMSRITLKITDIRVERVQDISDKDAKAEGEPFGFPPGVAECHTAIELFMGYWDPLNEKRGFGWDKNPWVWVVEFEKVNQELHEAIRSFNEKGEKSWEEIKKELSL